jgi:hypothetical protein
MNIRITVNRAAVMGGHAWQLLGAPTYKGHKDATGIIGNTVLDISGFHMRKNFFENYPQSGQVPVLSWEEKV